MVFKGQQACELSSEEDIETLRDMVQSDQSIYTEKLLQNVHRKKGKVSVKPKQTSLHMIPTNNLSRSSENESYDLERSQEMLQNSIINSRRSIREFGH